EESILSIQSQLEPNQPYGMCLISNIHNSAHEMKQVELFIQYQIPVIEVAAFATISLPLVYCRIKGLSQKGDQIWIPRHLIGKCSRLEVARLFLSPPPLNIVQELLQSQLISPEEAAVSQYIPMVDDLAIEADSGGHTDQGVAFSLVPAMISLRNQMAQKYQYQERILVGCGGGIGTPQAVVSAFQLGAEFIFTGSINQCTVESGAHPVVKDLLSTVSIHDLTLAPAGDMFELGAKVQVVKKETEFPKRANKLYQLFTQYASLDAISASIKKELETEYFKRSLDEVWKEISEYKQKKNPEQLQEAEENERLRIRLIFQWYFAHSTSVTLRGRLEEKDNFQIHCGPALGSFNQWVQGTRYEHWKNRHVDEITENLFTQACSLLQNQPGLKQESEDVKAYGSQDKNQVPASASFPETNRYQHSGNYSIAIIGRSGQFPQSRNIKEFWENLARGIDCITEIPKDRWSIEEYYHAVETMEGKTNCKW
ncbi:MAG: PfaD family polyunsaturated fatty acid/polyketide biosynthesis protein, partial [Planctomycetes bacterium]|nr:PfaD family polyunsaturated fatty acid/polyketide biosynthesis protein [Planctomycetota bacterium]